MTDWFKAARAATCDVPGFKFADAPNRRGQHVRFAFASTLAPLIAGLFLWRACVRSNLWYTDSYASPILVRLSKSTPAPLWRGFFFYRLITVSMATRSDPRPTPRKRTAPGRVFARDQGLFLLVWWLSPGPRLYKAGCVQPKPPELSRRQASHRRHGTASSSR